MKRLPLLLSGILFFILTASLVSDSTGLKTLTVKKGVFTVNGVQVNDDWKIKEILSTLGTPSRTNDGYNKTHTYDDCGTVLFEKKLEDGTPSGNLLEFQVYFSKAETNNVVPTGVYSGTVKIDKLTVSKDLTAATMLKKLKKWTKTDSYMEHNYRMAYKELYVYFQFDDSETSLTKISVGPNKRK